MCVFLAGGAAENLREPNRDGDKKAESIFFCILYNGLGHCDFTAYDGVCDYEIFQRISDTHAACGYGRVPEDRSKIRGRKRDICDVQHGDYDAAVGGVCGVYELGISSNLIIENINIGIWALIGGLTLSIILWKMQNLKTEISDWETCTEEDFAPAFLSIRNEFALTERETEILTEIFEGSGNGEIAEKLFISENTVKTHIHNLLRKMGAASRLEAVGMVRSRMAEIRQLSVIECD